MKRASAGVDFANFVTRVASRRLDSEVVADRRLVRDAAFEEAVEQPAEKMRRLAKSWGRTGVSDGLLPSTAFAAEPPTIELTAEEAVALGMIQGPVGGGTFTIQDDTVSEDIVVEHMDIEEPLSTLRSLLEQRLCISLINHEFWLQNQQLLDPSRNLVEQCVQGEGMVQINCELASFPDPVTPPRINIVDILKPAEEVAEPDDDDGAAYPESSVPTAIGESRGKEEAEEEKEVTRWVVDQTFRKEQERLGIPLDPRHWTCAHVRHWIRWAIVEFRLRGVDANEWIHITGPDLVDMTHEMFAALVPEDKGDMFWTHLELLRKCKFVAIVQAQPKNDPSTKTLRNSSSVRVRPSRPQTLNSDSPVQIPSSFSSSLYNDIHNNNNKVAEVPSVSPQIIGDEPRLPVRANNGANPTNNGQIQLWQFLLELLTDYSCSDAIHWVGEEGEFKLHNPELVAQMWGQRKNKPTMNYDKLSRALRYYYDGDMITKVQGKRFVYKFVCDLKTLLGFSPKELAALVQECAAKKANQGNTRNGFVADNEGASAESDDEADAATLALRAAVNNLSQLTATGGHVTGALGVAPSSSSSSPSTSALPSSFTRILVRRPNSAGAARPTAAATAGVVGAGLDLD